MSQLLLTYHESDREFHLPVHLFLAVDVHFHKIHKHCALVACACPFYHVISIRLILVVLFVRIIAIDELLLDDFVLLE